MRGPPHDIVVWGVTRWPNVDDLVAEEAGAVSRRRAGAGTRPYGMAQMLAAPQISDAAEALIAFAA